MDPLQASSAASCLLVQPRRVVHGPAIIAQHRPGGVVSGGRGCCCSGVPGLTLGSVVFARCFVAKLFEDSADGREIWPLLRIRIPARVEDLVEPEAKDSLLTFSVSPRQQLINAFLL